MIIAGTGHRVEDCEDEVTVRTKIREALRALQPDVVITGMAAGYDLWLGAEARDLGIEIWCAKPWATHGPRKEDEELYHSLISTASLVHNVDSAKTYPGPWVYHKRNEWMVDHCDLLLAYWSGKEKGGTYACVKYAEKVGREMENIYG